MVKQEPAKKSQYQMDLSAAGCAAGKDYKFGETVETWTDYLYSRYHPRSINIINDLEHSSTEDTFDCFTAGAELWKTEYFQEDYSDNIRQYIEECNRCQVNYTTPFNPGLHLKRIPLRVSKPSLTAQTDFLALASNASSTSMTNIPNRALQFLFSRR